MSKHNRTSRRRRIAFGLGATGGGLLAAAFMPMGIALAAPITRPRSLPHRHRDRAFSRLPLPVKSTRWPTLADTLSRPYLLNPALAAQLDYDIDNGHAFSFSGLDGIPAEPRATRRIRLLTT